MSETIVESHTLHFAEFDAEVAVNDAGDIEVNFKRSGEIVASLDEANFDALVDMFEKARKPSDD